MMKIKIYQINHERDRQRLEFMNFAFVVRRTKTDRIQAEIYDCVYEGEVSCKSLESVYALFNVRKPKDYQQRALSISDVVEVLESDSVPRGTYFCDSFGFKEVVFAHSKEARESLMREQDSQREDRDREER